MKRLLLSGIITAVFLIGCATQYQQRGFTGGFAEAQTSRNQFTIAFAGNGYTSGQRAVELCLLRCAEVSLGHGFRYFALGQSSSEYDRSTAITTGGYVPIGHGNGVYFSTSQVIAKPSTANNILCFRDKPANIKSCFDARQTFDTLSKKYGVQKEVEQFPRFRLSKARLGVVIDIEKPQALAGLHQSANTSLMVESKPKLKIKSFTESSAQEAGLKLGDEILAVDGTAITNLAKFGEVASGWNIGHVAQVTVRRDSEKEITVPVTAVFNPVLQFEQISDIKCDRPVTEKDVVILHKDVHAIDAIPVSDYRDWENPVGSMEEAENYLIAAAANDGVNGVLILDSPESVRNFDSKAEENVGFMCVLLLIPQARLGLEFETGMGYEHRFVIRRIQNAEAETAGLRIGDSILAINGIDLVQSASAARNDRLKWKIGQVVQVTVARDGRERTFPVEVIANPPALPRVNNS